MLGTMMIMRSWLEGHQSFGFMGRRLIAISHLMPDDAQATSILHCKMEIGEIIVIECNIHDASIYLSQLTKQ